VGIFSKEDENKNNNEKIHTENSDNLKSKALKLLHIKVLNKIERWLSAWLNNIYKNEGWGAHGWDIHKLCFIHFVSHKTKYNSS